MAHPSHNDYIGCCRILTGQAVGTFYYKERDLMETVISAELRWLCYMC